MTNYLHVYLRPKAGVTQEMVKAKMNLAVDWYKYSPNCWILKTTSGIAKWQTRLKPLVAPSGSLLILAVDPTKRQGWIAKSVWAWFRKHDIKKNDDQSTGS